MQRCQPQHGTRLRKHLRFQSGALTIAGADDKGQQPGGAAELPPIEDELRRLSGLRTQRQHGGGQHRACGTRHLGIDRGDGDEAQRLGLGQPGLQRGLGQRAQQAHGFGAGGGEHHGVVRRAVHLPGAALVGDVLHARAGVHAGAVASQPARRGFGEDAAQVGARQQQMRAAPAAEQAVLQHAQKHLAAGFVRRGVERRNAQRVDELVHQPPGQPCAQLGHGGLRRAAKAAQAPGGGRAQQRGLVAPAPAARAGDACERIPRRREVGQAQPGAVGEGEGQRLAVEHVFRPHPHLAHEAQAFGVGADQDVLAVVQRQSVGVQRTGTAAHAARGLEDGGPHARCGQFNGGRQTGPAGADDGDTHAQKRPSACIFHASQNLRSGVRLVRWFSTWKLSRSISRSSVR